MAEESCPACKSSKRVFEGNPRNQVSEYVTCYQCSGRGVIDVDTTGSTDVSAAAGTSRVRAMILHILEAVACGPSSLRLRFDDGREKEVDVSPLLRGPVFEPLRSPAYFARVVVDPVCGTVVWPNGADFAPEALHQLPQEHPVHSHAPNPPLQPTGSAGG